MKILVSGFQRFLDYPVNTSEVMAGLLGQSPGIHAITLPVTYRDAFIKLKAEIEIYNPDVVLCLGLAAKRNFISLEKVAINHIDCEFPDNDGTIYRDVPIVKEGPDAYFSNLPLNQMLAASNLFPTEVSYTAGAYVCNFLMYNVLHFLRSSEIRSGFIHLPELNQDQDVLHESLKKIIQVF